MSRSLLKHSGVRVRRERDTYVFIIPADKAEKIQKEYGFSFDQLRIGGDIPLPELAVHIDEQAASEANWGVICELARHKVETTKLQYEDWYERVAYKCRVHLMSKYKTITEGQLKGYVYTRYPDKLRIKRQRIADLEFQYRMLNNVIRAALAVKGQLLPTLRNIVQGKSEGLAGISVKMAGRVRAKLKT